MGFAQLFFKKGNFIDTIELDIIIREGATATARVTANPVENGADSNDHIIIDPMAFTVEGLVSNVSSSSIDQFSTAVENVVNRFNGDPSKSQQAWDDLLNLMISRTPFTLVQGLKTYENVVILSLSEQQDKDTANGLFFTATMKEIIFVGSQIITAEQFNESDTADKMIPSTEGGLKQLQE